MNNIYTGENEIITEIDQVPNILRVCEHCKDVIGQNEDYVNFKCDHNTHVKCWIDYIKDGRDSCSFCQESILFPIIINNKRDMDRTVRTIIRAQDKNIMEMYKTDEKYRKDVKDIISIRNKVLKTRKEVYSNTEKEEMAKINKLQEKFVDYVDNMKKELHRNIKSTDKFKNYSKLSHKYRSLFIKFEETYGHGFDDYLVAKNLQHVGGRYISRHKIREELNPTQFLRRVLKLHRYYFF